MTPLANNERFRPQFHFTPPSMWMNDPNGLVYYAGEYHLFYQYHADDIVQGPMHWGHAVSVDLVNWLHLPTALHLDDIGYIYSGSAVIDWQDTARFGAEAMVAIFTHHDPATLNQSQSIAHSLDHGRSWQKYARNPVIPTPANVRDFRDPKVFWYETDDGQGHWVMSLATTNAILFYTSPDLINWQASGAFGFGHGSTTGEWETPDLFQLAVDNGPEKRWVLIAGIGSGAPAGGSGEQYFVGDFDGKSFTSENPKGTILWFDFGADAYATQSWSDMPDDRRLIISWMSNWAYAGCTPTSPWRGAMTLPRELKLITTAEGIRITQEPVPELLALRGQHSSWKNKTIPANGCFLPEPSGRLLEIMVEFAVPQNTGEQFGVRLRSGKDEYTTVGYASKAGRLFIDRRKAGEVDFSEAFSGLHVAPLSPQDGRIHLRIFVDHASVEVFANNGRVTMTDQIFPTGSDLQIELFAGSSPIIINKLDIYQLHAANYYQVATP